MTLRSAIDLLALLICSVYCTIPLFWLVIHPFISRWRKHGRRGFALLVPIWGGFVALAFCSMWPFRFAQFYTCQRTHDRGLLLNKAALSQAADQARVRFLGYRALRELMRGR